MSSTSALPGMGNLPSPGQGYYHRNAGASPGQTADPSDSFQSDSIAGRAASLLDAKFGRNDKGGNQALTLELGQTSVRFNREDERTLDATLSQTVRQLQASGSAVLNATPNGPSPMGSPATQQLLSMFR